MVPSKRSSTSTSTKPDTRCTVVLIFARWLLVKFRSDKSCRGGFGGGGALRFIGGELNGFTATWVVGSGLLLQWSKRSPTRSGALGDIVLCSEGSSVVSEGTTIEEGRRWE